MSWKPTIPISPFLPEKPSSTITLPRLVEWARRFHDAIYGLYVTLSQRADQVVIDLPTANLPAPSGSRRIILDQDQGYRPWYDAGGATLDEITATPRVHAATHETGGTDPLKLDNLAAPDDTTDLNATTSLHGLLLKAVAPAAGLLNVVGVANGETAYALKVLFDTASPEVLGTAASGSSLLAARRDHVHTLPKLDDLAAPDDTTDLDVSTAKHGLVPKAPNDTTKFLRGDATWAVPGGASMQGFALFMSDNCAQENLWSGYKQEKTIAVTLPSGCTVNRAYLKWVGFIKNTSASANYIANGNISIKKDAGSFVQYLSIVNLAQLAASAGSYFEFVEGDVSGTVTGSGTYTVNLDDSSGNCSPNANTLMLEGHWELGVVFTTA